MDSSIVEKNLYNLFSLSGKTAMITGAGGGIGRELALGLAGAGADVALCDIQVKEVESLKAEIEASGGSALAYNLDVSGMDDIKKCVDDIVSKKGKIDILVNCAGVNKREGIFDVDEETFDKIMDINLKAVFFVSKCVGEVMKKNKSGSIINIGSHNTGAVLGAVSVYAASKSGVLAITRSMAVEWAGYGIRANCISPGHILTPLTTVTWEDPDRSQYLKERISMERPGDPKEIVGVCIFLASDASSYVTGAEYRVDGGCLAGGKPWRM